MKKFLFIIMALCTFGACEKSNSVEETKSPSEFTLSIQSDATTFFEDREYCFVEDDKYDYEFDIISGNEDYKVVDSHDCRVTIKESKVIVNMYSRDSYFTLEDRECLQKSVWISSSNDMFNVWYAGHSLLTTLCEQGSNEDVFPDFGVGEYTIELVKGVSASAEIISENKIKYTSLCRGTSHFVILDSRGMSLNYKIKTYGHVDMRDGFKDVDVVSEDCLTIQLDKDMDWEMRLVGLDPIFDIVSLHRGGDKLDYDYLQVNIGANVSKYDVGRVNLRSKEGADVNIRFNVK